ncbi:lectin C-type domain protein [Ancylostoma caninum]|uniref:Lectin C-type domain protein n=1 Tax=Ancylostoma caninum TaxID=29170 RepID=A0A368H4E0_ANCCA|nr:lectin C-type domain protein [Ancylostoma caninum]
MWYDLTTFQSTDDMINSAYLTYDGNRGTNIEAAIKMASKSFATSSHRDNAQKVIVIVASDYQEGNYNDPRAAAEAFKEDGGYIITVEYVQEHDEPIPLLANLASGPQFQFTNRFGNLTAKDLRTAFCKANCFCPTNYNPDNQGDIAPLGGCYRPVSIPAIEVLAARNCRQHHNATLAKVEDISKAAFLTTLFSPKTKFWIGLRLVDGVYQWPDGTTLQSNSYQMWAPGYPNPAAGDCVYMYQYSGFGFGWFNDDCGDDQNYVCHNAPCSADNYCSSRT